MCIRNVYIQIAGTANVVIVLVKNVFCLDILMSLLMYHVITNNLMQCSNPVA